jgi:hypothetical protein
MGSSGSECSSTQHEAHARASVSASEGDEAGSGEHSSRPPSRSGRDAASAVAAAAASRRAAAIATRVKEHLCLYEGTTLPIKSHKQASERMAQLARILDPRVRFWRVDQETRLNLLFAGISVSRRLHVDELDGEARNDLSRTQLLLFVLQAYSEDTARAPRELQPSQGQSQGDATSTGVAQAADPGSGTPPRASACADDDAEAAASATTAETAAASKAAASAPAPTSAAHAETLAAFGRASVWSIQQGGNTMTTNAVVSDATAESAVPPKSAPEEIPSPSMVCRAALGVVSMASADEVGLERAGELADVFFKTSALALSADLLLAAGAPSADAPAGGTDFLTLDCVNVVRELNDPLKQDDLAAISDAAESELGQTLLRDFILSFALPQSVVGVRRTAVLGRAASAHATEFYSQTVGDAHDCAMRGATWTWANDGNMLHKACALLAGACMILTQRAHELGAADRARAAERAKKKQKLQSAADVMRTADAFGGRVNLPFLETASPAAALARAALVPHTNEWFVFKVRAGGKPVVQLRQGGFEGLCQAILVVCS